MIRRHIEARIVESLADTPAVFLQGARQCGKSTLARIIAEAPHPARYVSLDDATAFAAAQADPEQFIANQPYPLVIDEVQRVPQLFRAIKASVDRDRRAGRFLLTGSADVAVVPELSHSLAGRVEVHTLWPFSQGELEGRRETFIEALFSPHLPTADLRGESRVDLLARASTGGYPEPIQRSAERRHAWFESYVTTILQREVRDLTNLDALGELPRLLTSAASRTAQLLNYAELARTLSLPQTTLKRYLALLLGTFLVRTLPAWFRNVGKRLAKAPKLVVADTGLASHLLGVCRIGRTGAGEGELGCCGGGIITWGTSRVGVGMAADMGYNWSRKRQPTEYSWQTTFARLIGTRRCSCRHPYRSGCRTSIWHAL